MCPGRLLPRAVYVIGRAPMPMPGIWSSPGFIIAAVSASGFGSGMKVVGSFSEPGVPGCRFSK
eukprot:4316080-Lingulodinium_polyedra.AAC.1